jgi:hypothetical protein
MASLLTKQVIKGASPDEMVKLTQGSGIESPEIPAHVKTWIDFNEFSSDMLKKNL